MAGPVTQKPEKKNTGDWADKDSRKRKKKVPRGRRGGDPGRTTRGWGSRVRGGYGKKRRCRGRVLAKKNQKKHGERDGKNLQGRKAKGTQGPQRPTDGLTTWAGTKHETAREKKLTQTTDGGDSKRTRKPHSK